MADHDNDWASSQAKRRQRTILITVGIFIFLGLVIIKNNQSFLLGIVAKKQELPPRAAVGGRVLPKDHSLDSSGVGRVSENQQRKHPDTLFAQQKTISQKAAHSVVGTRDVSLHRSEKNLSSVSQVQAAKHILISAPQPDTHRLTVPGSVTPSRVPLHGIVCRLTDPSTIDVTVSIDLLVDPGPLLDEVLLKREGLRVLVVELMRGKTASQITNRQLRNELPSRLGAYLQQGTLRGIDIVEISIGKE